jgi:hypothetical protein
MKIIIFSRLKQIYTKSRIWVRVDRVAAVLVLMLNNFKMIDQFNTLFQGTARWNHWIGDGLKHRDSSELLVKKIVAAYLNNNSTAEN